MRGLLERLGPTEMPTKGLQAEARAEIIRLRAGLEEIADARFQESDEALIQHVCAIVGAMLGENMP